MSEHRTYTCLMCEGRPVFHGKIGAAMHARVAHVELLETHHPDEFFAEGPEFVVEEPTHYGPYLCVCLGDEGLECGEKRISDIQMRSHLNGMHEIEPDLAEYGVHYLNEQDYAARDKKLYEFFAKPLAPRQLDVVREFGRSLESIRGVADFLTDCDAA